MLSHWQFRKPFLPNYSNSIWETNFSFVKFWFKNNYNTSKAYQLSVLESFDISRSNKNNLIIIILVCLYKDSIVRRIVFLFWRVPFQRQYGVKRSVCRYSKISGKKYNNNGRIFVKNFFSNFSWKFRLKTSKKIILLWPKFI